MQTRMVGAALGLALALAACGGSPGPVEGGDPGGGGGGGGGETPTAISGRVTVSAGQSAGGVQVKACYAQDCSDSRSRQVSADGAGNYTIGGLQKVRYRVVAFKDQNGDGKTGYGDLSGEFAGPVVPPAQDVNIALTVVTTGQPGSLGTIVYDSGNKIYRIDPADGRRVSVAGTCPATVDSYPDLASTGEIGVRCGFGASDIVVYNPDGTTGLTLRPPGGIRGHLAFSPGAERIAYESGESPGYPVKVIDRAGRELASFPNTFSPSWLPDGRLGLLSGNGVFVSDGALKTLSKIDRGGVVNPSDLAVSPDGSRVAFALNSHVWTMNIDGGALTQASVSGGREDNPAWSPDGRLLALVVRESSLGGYIQVKTFGTDEGFVPLGDADGKAVYLTGTMNWR
ncbi:PD40 domain-containing protein [Deinococcus planocerae]|uniref:PD40 domain-containing protein n=1 Tax=Deinococcus planocerae TaxID=1737569 RepID=UPI0015E0E859|nr:PD40 domain-containing protein [Deinococcus planocerae]